MIDKDKAFPLIVFAAAGPRERAATAAQRDADWERVKPLVEAAIVAGDALHNFHPNPHPIPIGRGICEWGPCKQLREALAKLEEVTS